MRFRRTLRKLVTTGALALMAGLGLAVPASASTDATIWHLTAVPDGGRVSCFGYYGTFLAGSHVLVVNWYHTSAECFGIATDHTIWHTWIGSGGWQRMPGGGHADDVRRPEEEGPDGYKGVVVWAASNNTLWEQDYYPGTGWTGDWYLI